jgi:hypothetical protein
MNENDANIQIGYQRDGYVLIKNLFSSAEIAEFRREIINVSRTLKDSDKPVYQGDIFTYDELRKFILNKKIIDQIKKLLGEEIVYYGDSSFRVENRDEISIKNASIGVGYHQDTPEDEYSDPITTEYKIVRMGIYLQDIKNYSGGLKVRKGSHRHVLIGRENIKRFLGLSRKERLSQGAFRIGAGINIKADIGDVIIWNLRTWHCGYAKRLKLLPNLHLSPRIERFIPDNWCKPLDKNGRIAVFASFGAPSKELEKFIEDRSNHFSNREHWLGSSFNKPHIIAEADQLGVKLRFDGLKNKTDLGVI